MQEIQKGNSNVKLIQLMRNFGQHNAILCGFNHVSGNYIITMDDDLQNPPEEIPKLIDKIHQGYDVVIGASEKKKDTFFKNIASFFIRNLVAIIFNKT